MSTINNDNVRKNVLKLIREYRDLHYCSKIALAERIGVKKNFIYDLEDPEMRFNPRLSTLEKLANFFDVSLSYIVREGEFLYRKENYEENIF